MKLKTNQFIYSFSLISIWLFSIYFSFKIENKTINRMSLNHLKSVTSIQHARIESIYRQNCERFSLVSSRTQLRLSLQKFYEDKNIKHNEKIRKILNDALSSIDNFKKISIYDTVDTFLLSTPHQLEPPSFLPKVNLNKSSIETSFQLNKNNEPMLILTGPLI